MTVIGTWLDDLNDGVGSMASGTSVGVLIGVE